MRLKSLLTIAFLTVLTIAASGQSITDIDFEKIKVDNLSEQQIQQLKAEAESRGLSTNEIVQLAVARGMPQTEAQKLQRRLGQVSGGGNQGAGGGSDRMRYTAPDTARANEFDSFFGADTRRDSLRFYQDIRFLQYQVQQDSLELERKKLQDKIFGFELFQNTSTSFQPALNIPTPKDYQLGPGDQLMIDIWGAAETTYQPQITPEGTINITNIGPISLNGLTIEEASAKLQERLGEIYSGLNPADDSQKDTYMQVSLGQVRSINVSVIGEVRQPGSYSLPSLATVFNALYSAGGPTVTGSFRDIQVLRGDSVAATFDLYDLIINSDQSDNIRLRSQDIIKISPYINRVEVAGEVKREGLYETKEGDRLSNLIEYAGGFTGDAYSHRIRITGNDSRQRTIDDVTKSNFDNYEITNGDSVTVGKVLDRFKNLVEIEGAVFREGKYALTDTSTVASLIKRAEGLRGDAFQNRGLIYREQDDYTLKSIPFNVAEVMTDSTKDIPLEKNDLVMISSILDMKLNYFVEIEGPVQNPNKYKFAEEMTLEDLILQAGGFKQGATPNHVEVARRKTRANQDEYNTSQIAQIHRFDLNEDLSLDAEASNFVLNPFDKVYVRSIPNYSEQQNIVISGEVKYPGTYSMQSKNDRISDIVQRAGGLSANAYPEGATLYRELDDDQLASDSDEEPQGFYVAGEDTLQSRAKDQKETRTISKIGISLPHIMKNPGSKYDLFVQEADSIVIPKELQTVTVDGGVFYPRSVRYQEGMNYKDYIASAGGFTNLARKGRSYVIYANGDVEKVKRFLFFKNYPEVKPGAKLVVPEKPESAKLSPQERISILSAITSTAALIVTTIVQVNR
ncbi:SLBB domain-containing protein [Fodinibius sp. Rm-B-1B1-1]|uniref:SLBB domain-containing protein n=1 Tax=Fodinibius alkaliphilus TaxID=3140241 RepID=UPI00315A4487